MGIEPDPNDPPLSPFLCFTAAPEAQGACYKDACAVPRFQPHLTRRNGAAQSQFRVDPGHLCATHVDANPGNGTLRLSSDFPAIGAGANSWVRAPSNSGESHRAEGVAPGPNGGNNARDWRVIRKCERRRTGRLTSN